MQTLEKRVLIITYYWPPSGGAGVQRWLKFVKYLPQFGVQPYVYTPENPEFPVLDPDLLNDIPTECVVIKKPIWEPYSIYKKLMGIKAEDKIAPGFIRSDKRKSWLHKLSVWIRGNFLVPDPRMFWVNPSIAFLNKYIQKEGIDVIVSTGPPHSMHLIGLGLKKKYPNIKWIADFRDPWTNIDFYKELMLTGWADQKHKNLEKKVLQNADVILTVGETLKQELQNLGAHHVHVITNGFDDDDTSSISTVNLDQDHFNLTYVGSLPKSRNHRSLWQAIQELGQENKSFQQKVKLTLVGQKDISVIEDLEKYNLTNSSHIIDYVSHQEAIQFQNKASILLLLSNRSVNAKGILTGKFFEYLATQKPILAIGDPKGDMNSILMETKAGEMCDFDDISKIKKVLNEWFQLYEKGELKILSQNYQNYSRRHLTQELVQLLY